MKVSTSKIQSALRKELIDILQNYYDATVCFYNWRKGDDM